MGMLYTLVAQQGTSSMSAGEVGVDAATRQQHDVAQRQETALKQEEADEAKLDSGGGLFGAICHVFEHLGDNLVHGRIADAGADAVSDVVNTVDSPHLLAQLEELAPQVAEYVGVAAAVVGAVAITGASGGTGGIAVAAVVVALSASGMLAEKTHCFGKASDAIGLGLEVASAVVSFGGSSAMAADGALRTASAVADGVAGGTGAIAGASSIAVGNVRADALDDAADVRMATQQMNRNARLVADLVAGLKDAQQSNKNALAALAGAAQTYGQTLTLAAAKA
jgi:hypothetical protein